ncbi:MAG: UvrD-helicase domain-containing protein [Prevotellaceae bacterium]|jgi:ATP-dependent exoDNAse (exonuclease V) beta subunit|nr:UvrD-helicase domain-containing protein [Prevotellaceae bacterium]
MLNIYRASAGSGKTYTIALQYIAQLLRGTAHRHILAVTFTKDATEEMKARILTELYGLANRLDNGFLQSLQRELPAMSEDDISRKAAAALTNILHDYSRFHVTTIDSFFQQVVRNLAKELGVGSQFNIELDTEIPIKDAVKAVLQEASENADTLQRITAFVEHKLEDGRWSIEKDLLQFGQNIFKESFQEQEKRLREQLHENPNKIKETIAECKKIKKIFENAMAQYAGGFSENNFDFHYSAKGIPGYFKKIRNKKYEEPNIYVNAVLSGDKGKDGDLHFLPLLQETENYRNKNIQKYNSACLLLKYVHQLELIEKISEKIDEQNAEQNRFMLAKTAQLLSEMVGESDASFVYEKIGAEIRHVVIDEFQDTSTLQWQNFQALISEMIAGRRFGMLVGDVKQSIYRWRNGNWRILNDIENTLGEQADYRTLDTNYRSEKAVVDFNNHLFKNAVTGLSGSLKKAYESVEQKSIDKSNAGYVSVDFVDKDEERDYNEVAIDTIAEKVQKLLENGVSVSDICILCRKNQQIRDIAAELPKRIKVKIISEEAYQLGSSHALRIITAALRSIAEPENLVPKAELSFLLNQNDFQFSIHNSQLPLYDLIQEIVRQFKLNIGGESAFLYAFMDKTADYLSRNTADIRAFLEYWDTRLCNESVPLPTGKDSNRDGILAMSIHKSKGLQFHTVIVPFADWDMAPKSSLYKQNLLWCGSTSLTNPVVERSRNALTNPVVERSRNALTSPFDLSLLPIEYNEQMENSLFKPAFDSETEMLEMDSLNVLYVALTRAEKNLMLIAKTPAKKSETPKIQNILENVLKGNMESGTIVKSEDKKEDKTENVFKNTDARQEEITFNPILTEVKYKQTTQAQRFVKGEEGWEDRNEYVKEGNVIHRLFEYVKMPADVENAVSSLIEKGVINLSDKEKYAEKIKKHIIQKPEWFSENYKVINECIILTADGTFRCDRVMLDEQDKAIVVDYKTGAVQNTHKKQVQEYMQLLQKMGFSQTEGYIWYLNENKIIEVE